MFRHLRQKLVKDDGFTLIELMAVMVIGILIALIAAPNVAKLFDKANTESDAASMDMMERSAEIAYATSGGDESQFENGGYTVDGLVDEGYLDYDTSVGNLDGTMVHRGNGVFAYSGQNLLKNSDFHEELVQGKMPYWNSNAEWTLNGTDTKYVTINSTSRGIFQIPQGLNDSTTYTLSFYAKGETGNDALRAGFLNQMGDKQKVFNLTSDWKRYEYTFPTNLDLSTSGGNILHFYGAKGIPSISFIQLEEGSAATAWSPTMEGA